MEKRDGINQRKRLYKILRRHVREEDADLTDDEQVYAVVNRYRKERGQPLIDPNE